MILAGAAEITGEKSMGKQNQKVLVLDFGGQYKQLIARRVREWGVYSSIEPGNLPAEKIREIAPIGIILTG
jgi:GMP synthase (glutamine-hydrolysing)